jgi:hypothetical protein
MANSFLFVVLSFFIAGMISENQRLPHTVGTLESLLVATRYQVSTFFVN